MATDTKGWVVKCPLAQLRLAEGGYAHFYEGASVPELFEGVAETLHAEGLIGPADEDFQPAERPEPGAGRDVDLGKWVKKSGAKPVAKPADK